ncbi:MAG: hypothetical protein ACKPKO_07550, partial [Candidatus Fonsibacter sp.]
MPEPEFIPSGPKYFAVASLDDSPRSVKFRLPKGYKDKTTIGMNNQWNNQGRWKEGGPIDLDDQYLVQSGLGYMSARQKAIELAKVVDRDCDSLGIARHPLGVGSWNDDRRVPLYWVECSDTGRPAVLTYDCR